MSELLSGIERQIDAAEHPRRSAPTVRK
jgi:hypothetical protein